ncbi:hypothetical protein CMV37_30220 [Bacillus cereus]|nr:hypothetical protein CMV37_30220 [Bacillus cereus]
MPMKIDMTWSILGILLSVITTIIVVWIAAKQSLSAKPIHLLQINKERKKKVYFDHLVKIRFFYFL